MPLKVEDGDGAQSEPRVSSAAEPGEDEFERELKLLNEPVSEGRRIPSVQASPPVVSAVSHPSPTAERGCNETAAPARGASACGVALSAAPRALATRNTSDGYSTSRPSTPTAEPFAAACNRAHDLLKSPRNPQGPTRALSQPTEQPTSSASAPSFKSVLDDPIFDSVLDDPIFH